MTSETAGAPGQTNVDAESFLQADDLTNAATNAANGMLVANGLSVPRGIIGDTSARNSPVDANEDTFSPHSNKGDREDDEDEILKTAPENNVPPPYDNVQDRNDIHANSALADSASMIDAALELTPPTALDKVLFSQPNASFPNQPRFAHSNPPFPIPMGYGMQGNPGNLSLEDSPTPFTSAAFPPIDIGNLFGRQLGYGYSPFFSPQAPVPTNNLLPARTEMTPQALLSLEDALDRNSTAKPPKRDREEADDAAREQEADSSSSIGKKAPSKRRKVNKVGAEAAATAGSARYGTSAKKMMPRRTLSGNAQVSAEERRRIRAERNRESAEKSRLRHKQRTEELERDVYHKRIENREVKASVDTYYAQLQGVADTIEKGTPREEAMKKVPALYTALASMRKAIEQCVWTYRDPREPEIPLKIPRN